MIDFNKEDFKLLSDKEVPPLKKLLIEQNLYDAELSPIKSLYKISKFFVGLLLEPDAKFYFVPVMRQVLNDAIRVAALKRHAPEGSKKKKAISKRPKTSGLSIGAPAIVARLDML